MALWTIKTIITVTSIGDYSLNICVNTVSDLFYLWDYKTFRQLKTTYKNANIIIYFILLFYII